MSSHQSRNKKFWAKDMGTRGVVIKDLTTKYHDVVKTLPDTNDNKIVEKLSELDK
jgi:hypothetical protein